MVRNLQGDMKRMKCDGFDNGNFTCLVGKKILIAGGTGFIGKRCVQVFEKLGCQLTVITRRAQMMDEKVNYIKVDLRDVDGLRKCLDSEEFDHAVYLAANIPLAGSAKETYLEAKCSTFDPFVNFCEVVLSKVKSFIYISSIDVIGACEKEDYTETEEINRPTPYGLAKYVGEFYVKTMCETLNVPYKILRFSQVYGANEPAVRIIPIIKNIKESKRIKKGLETYKLKTYMVVKKQPNGKWLIIEEMMQTKVQLFLKYADKN